MALTERDFSLFEPAAAPQREPQRPHPKTKPRREPMRSVRPPREESLTSKNAKAQTAWKRSVVAWAIVSAVGLCLFAMVQSETAHHGEIAARRQLQAQLAVEQQRNISYRTQIERKFSLEIIQDIALNEYRMVPVEGGRVIYLNILRGDQRLD